MNHLLCGRDALDRIIDLHVAGTRTRYARAWRRRRAERGRYVSAFDEAMCYADALARGCPLPPWPMLFGRNGYLPLIERYTGDRSILSDRR